MKHTGFPRVALAIATAVTVAGLARAQQDQGVKQVEALVKASGSTVQAIAQTKLQLMKTMDVYNALMADDAKDRKKMYRDLQKEMENTEKRRAEITTRAGAMTTEAEALFKSWETSAAAIGEREPPQAKPGALEPDEGGLRRDSNRGTRGRPSCTIRS